MLMDERYVNSSNPALDVFLFQLATKYSISRTYSPGEVIFAEGDTGRTMLLILEGIVKVMKRSSEDGSPVEIAKRGAGEFFGEMALVEQSPRFASVVAVTDCEVLEFSKENFERIIKEQPALATRVLRSLSRKLRESDSDRIAELEESNRLLDVSNKELKRLNAFLDTVIDQSPTAIFITTKTGSIFRRNVAADRMFELSEDDINFNVQDLFQDLSIDEFGLDSNPNWHGEITAKRRQETFPAYISVTSLTGHDNSILYLIICQDISELQAFNKAMREVERYSSAQSTAAEFAHDLKNYFGAITCGVDLLLESLSTEQRDRLSRTVEAVQSSVRQIMNYVDSAMVQSRDSSSAKPKDVASVIRAVMRFCKTQVRFQGIELKLYVHPNTPGTIRLKEVQVQSVILNLLVNAAEALSDLTDGDRKRIAVTVEPESDRRNLRISVADNGPGVDPEILPSLFKERKTTKRGGHGIGLVSVGKIINSYGGSVEVHSELGKGATFEVVLPIEEGCSDDA